MHMTDSPLTEEDAELTQPEAAADAPSLMEQAARRIEELEQQAAAYKDQALRALAEAENTRRRARRDVEEATQYAVTGFARDLVSVVENLQRASGSVSVGQRGESALLNTIAEGVEMTMSELLGIFEKYGIVRIDPVGLKFDHQFHQAVAQIPRDDVEPGTVIDVLQAGYVLHDRLLRPAMVCVSKKPDAPKPADA